MSSAFFSSFLLLYSDYLINFNGCKAKKDQVKGYLVNSVLFNWMKNEIFLRSRAIRLTFDMAYLILEVHSLQETECLIWNLISREIRYLFA